MKLYCTYDVFAPEDAPHKLEKCGREIVAIWHLPGRTLPVCREHDAEITRRTPTKYRKEVDDD